MKDWIIKIVALVVLLSFTSLPLAAEVLYYDTNNVGTPVAMWDSAGRKVWEVTYYPFGTEYQTSTMRRENTRKFAGKEKDKETDLSYFGARYYDDLSGRFLTPDPVRPVDAFTSKTNQKILDNPQRLNRYAYGLNNPYKYVDPDGEFAVVAALAIGAFALDAMMPQSTDVPNSKGFLDHADNATMVAGGLSVANLAFKLPKIVKSAKGVTGLFRNIKYNYRIDTNKVAPGEGGFHVHVYKGKDEIAKLNGKGGWVKTHEGKELLKPSQVPKDVKQDLNRLIKHTKKNLKD
ncbi:hypothetical protein JWJ90_09475 [Desulfobulbus rhabdoformis]|uniref:RHS repeat domain-containing protein n=1 Tax=Desulfobulbus rhabdoformis TaxID=34032 RepID=UPI001964358A|nr:RHS repeat-associated core domain-containing protein [Desulfobulbus rhabdoformis]MBM9614519.1 hypothetical protein [Desulfobulbus rhabdoformis]